MTVRRLALGTLLAAFGETAAPGWALGLLDDGLAGFALFGDNFRDVRQASALTGELRARRPGVILAVDEEGGDVTRLFHRTGSPYPGNAALGAIDDPALTRDVYRAIGADLRAAGIDLDLAPVVDVNTARTNPVIGTRSFGSDTTLVSRHARTAVQGLRSAGVTACAKHFPGHGATVSDSHLGLPLVDDPLPVLRERDLPPFAAAIAAGARAVMTAHIRIPSVTGDDPATFSPAVLGGLLRSELGFDGVIVTDALEMRGAAAAGGGVPGAAVRSLLAGADLLCLGSRADPALIEAVVDEIVAKVPVERLEDAARRTASLVEKPPGLAAAERAVRVEGDPGAVAGALIVQLDTGRTVAEGGVPWGLAPHVPGVLMVTSPSVEAIVAAAAGRPIVLVGRRMHQITGLVSGLIAAASAVGVVEMGWPSSWRPSPAARVWVTTYGASWASGRAAASALRLPGVTASSGIWGDFPVIS